VEWAVVIAVDKHASGAVHDGFCLTPDFGGEIAMPIAHPNQPNLKRAKGQP
jgi:hypothetical protein